MFVWFDFLVYLCKTLKKKENIINCSKKGTYTTNWIAMTNGKIGQNAASFVVFGSFFSTQFGITAVSRLPLLTRVSAMLRPIGRHRLGGVITHIENYIYSE